MTITCCKDLLWNYMKMQSRSRLTVLLVSPIPAWPPEISMPERANVSQSVNEVGLVSSKKLGSPHPNEHKRSALHNQIEWK
jgi:hypothetical protein